MVRALIVRTDGSLEVKELKADCKTYAEEISRNIVDKAKKCTYVECLPALKGYRNPGDKKGKRRHLSCYVHEEGMIRELPLNGYAGLFAALNLVLNFNMFVYGDVVVTGHSPGSGRDTNVDPYVVELFERYKRGGGGGDDDDDSSDDNDKEEFDEDAFFVALEKLDKEAGDEEEEEDDKESESDEVVPTKNNTNDIAVDQMTRTPKSVKVNKKKEKKGEKEISKNKRTISGGGGGGKDIKDDRPAPTKKSKKNKEL